MVENLLHRFRNKALRGRYSHYRPHSLVRGETLSVQAISWVIENSKHKLGNLIVLLMVANHARSDGTGAWPSVVTLGKESRLTERQTRRCLRVLEKSGELVTERGVGPHGCNLYSIPGVKLSGGKIVQEGGTNHAENVSKMSPEPSFNRPRRKERTQNRRASCVGLDSRIYPNGY